MESTSKTEFIVTYYYKDGTTLNEYYTDYGTAYYAAESEMKAHKDSRNYYEIKEICTSEKIIKSTK
jgi:hypothetical protein